MISAHSKTRKVVPEETVQEMPQFLKMGVVNSSGSIGKPLKPQSRVGTAKPSAKTSRVHTNNQPVQPQKPDQSVMVTNISSIMKEGCPSSIKRKRNTRTNSLMWAQSTQNLNSTTLKIGQSQKRQSYELKPT